MEARSLLEFTRSIMHVPRDLAGKVIGRGGNVIQQILEKSRLNNIKVIGDEEAQERRINTKGEVWVIVKAKFCQKWIGEISTCSYVV